ncbi:uncharacterized protein EI90DRAFT_3292328, partial [Cantharellus anzutake]|uniref:uncharacterized protein n=1 Tax=Cantharellus anzutake TaxID=1750568 RepID=UPI001904C2E4
MRPRNLSFPLFLLCLSQAALLVQAVALFHFSFRPIPSTYSRYPSNLTYNSSHQAEITKREDDPFREVFFPPRSKLIAHGHFRPLVFSFSYPSVSGWNECNSPSQREFPRPLVLTCFVPPHTCILIARYRSLNPSYWLRVHLVIQTFAALLIISGFAIGVNYNHDAYDGYDYRNVRHGRIGIALFVLYLVQFSLGFFIHYIKLPSLNPFLSSSSKLASTPQSQPPHPLATHPPQNIFHVIIGLTILCLSIYQVRTGYRDMYPLWTGLDTPGSVNDVWGVWVGVILGVWVLGCFVGVRSYLKAKQSWNGSRSGSGMMLQRRDGEYE